MQAIIGKNLDGECYDPRDAGKATLGKLTTGPSGFLNWLGVHVGVCNLASSHERIIAWQKALAETKTGFFAESFAKDPHGVAKKLLRLRDDIYLAAPSSISLPDLVGSFKSSPRVQTLATIDAAFKKLSPPDGEAETLRKILLRLKSGLPSPLTSISLIEDAKNWPTLWREIWDELTKQKVVIKSHDFGASPSKKKSGDHSIIHYRADYLTEAAEAVAAYIAASKDLNTVVIHATEPRALDLALHRLGHPGLGHAESVSSGPAAAVLPIAINLSCAPSDPNIMLRLTELEPAPIPRGLCYKIADRIYENPTWDSKVADEIMKDYLESLKEKPDYEPVKASKISEWKCWMMLSDEGTPEKVTLKKLEANLTLLDSFINKTINLDSTDDDIRRSLATAKNDAAELTEVLRLTGKTEFTRSELRVTFGKIQSGGSLSADRDASSVVAVDHPSALIGPADTVIYWMGLDRTAPGRPWRFFTDSETKALGAAGINFIPTDVTFDEHAAATRRTFELAGKRFILVTAETMGQGISEPLPLWHEINGKFGGNLPTLSTREFTREVLPALKSMIIKTEPKTLPKFRPTWSIPASLIPTRKEESPSSIGLLLGCPFNYVLKYAAGLGETADWSVDPTSNLSGNLAELVITRFFESKPTLLTDAKQRELLSKLFDEAVAETYGVLAVAGQEDYKQKLKSETIEGGIHFAKVMNASGFEFESSQGELADDTAIGRIKGHYDFIFKSTKSGGERMIIDTKYSGVGYHVDANRHGFATQLAIYSRLLNNGKTWPKTAYYIITAKKFITSHEGLLDGVKPHKGPGEEALWKKVEDSVGKALQELKNGHVAVGTPGKTPADLETSGRMFPAPCNFCHYDGFCQISRRGQP